MIYNRLLQLDRAIEALQETIELEPDAYFVHLDLGQAYLGKSMYEQAMAEYEREKAITGDFSPAADMAIAALSVLMGDRDTGKKALQDMLQLAEHRYVPAVLIAWLYLLLGDTDRGFQWLEKSYDQRDPILIYLKVYPLYTMLNLTSDPRYKALLKKMNLDK